MLEKRYIGAFKSGEDFVKCDMLEYFRIRDGFIDHNIDYRRIWRDRKNNYAVFKLGRKIHIFDLEKDCLV